MQNLAPENLVKTVSIPQAELAAPFGDEKKAVLELIGSSAGSVEQSEGQEPTEEERLTYV
jgi:hypothetical protein